MTFCRSSGYTFADSDAAAYVAAVEAADAASLEDGVKSAIDALFAGLKADGEWNAFGVLRVYAGPRTLAGCAVPAKGVAPTLVNFVSGDLNRETGLVGDAASKRIDSNYSNTTPAQNSRQSWVWLTTATLDGTLRSVFGAGDNAAGSTSIRSNSSTAKQAYCSGLGAGNFTAAITAGLVGVNRSGSTNFIYRTGGASETLTVTSTTPLSANFSSLANSTPSRYSAHRIELEAHGGAWTNPANIESRISTYLAAIAAAIV